MHLHLLRRSSALAAGLVVIMFAIFLATGVGQESLQVVRTPADYLAKLLANPLALTLTVYADDAFILFYVTVFLSVAVARWPARASRPWMIAAAVLLFATGLLDLLENLDFVVLLKNAQLGLGPDADRIAARVGASLLKFHVSYLGLWFLGHALPTTTRLEKALVFALRWVQWPVGFAVALVPQPVAIGLVIVRLLLLLPAGVALSECPTRLRDRRTHVTWSRRSTQLPRMNRVVTTAVLLTALEAFTSEHHDEIELRDLVTRSNVIVIVEPATPATVKTEIAIAPKGGSREKYPPYTRIRSRYVVKEVLHSRGAKLETGKTIEVDAADFDTRLTVHKRYHLEGVRKIPIYTYYSPQKAPGEGAVIVFLSGSSDGWEFVAAGAIEHLDTRKAVEALLKAAQ